MFVLWFTSPFCGSFPAAAGRSRADCCHLFELLSCGSFFCHAPVFKLSPFCQPLPDLQCFSAIDGPASQLFLSVRLCLVSEPLKACSQKHANRLCLSSSGQLPFQHVFTHQLFRVAPSSFLPMESRFQQPATDMIFPSFFLPMSGGRFLRTICWSSGLLEILCQMYIVGLH